jgi:hypothetical protein
MRLTQIVEIIYVGQTFVIVYSQYVETLFFKLVIVFLFFFYNGTSFGTITIIWWGAYTKAKKLKKCKIVLNCYILAQNLDEMACLQNTKAFK